MKFRTWSEHFFLEKSSKMIGGRVQKKCTRKCPKQPQSPNPSVVFRIFLLPWNWSVYTVGNALKPLLIDSPESLDEVKKNPIEKFQFFLVEKVFKKMFEEKKSTFFEDKKLTFFSKNLKKKIEKSREKKCFFFKKSWFFSSNIFLKNFFDKKKLKFFDGIF